MTPTGFAAALFVAVMLDPTAVQADAPEWAVDVEQSHVGFVAHQMQVTIPARFRRFAATIRFASEDLAASAARIVVDLASVETPNKDIEDTIKLADWFDVARFPEALFETSKIEQVGEGRYDAHGLLTLRDVTQPVTVPMTITIAEDPDAAGMLLAHAVGEVTVSRLAFGIGQGQWTDVAVVSDDVDIRFDIAARRPKP